MIKLPGIMFIYHNLPASLLWLPVSRWLIPLARQSVYDAAFRLRKVQHSMVLILRALVLVCALNCLQAALACNTRIMQSQFAAFSVSNVS